MRYQWGLPTLGAIAAASDAELSIRQRYGASRAVTCHTALPRLPAARNSSVTSSPIASEWSVDPATEIDAGCHSGQFLGVVRKSKTSAMYGSRDDGFRARHHSALSLTRTAGEGRTDLHNLLQSVQCAFCVSFCDIGMALLALVNRFLQMFDGVCGVRISVNLLAGFRVSERRLGMRN